MKSALVRSDLTLITLENGTRFDALRPRGRCRRRGGTELAVVQGAGLSRHGREFILMGPRVEYRGRNPTMAQKGQFPGLC